MPGQDMPRATAYKSVVYQLNQSNLIHNSYPFLKKKKLNPAIGYKLIFLRRKATKHLTNYDVLV